MKEIRAVVLGLLAVVLVALELAFWRRPAAEFSRVKAYRVEVKEREGASTHNLSFTIPTNLIARIARFAPVDRIGRDLRADWGRGDVTPKQRADRRAALVAAQQKIERDHPEEMAKPFEESAVRREHAMLGLRINVQDLSRAVAGQMIVKVLEQLRRSNEERGVIK